MDAKQKRNVVDDIKALLPFIQGESIGKSAQKAIVKVLGRPDEHGLVRWCNEQRPKDQPLSMEGEVVKDTIQILTRLYARFGLFSSRYTDQDSQLEEAQRQLPKKIALLNTLCIDTKKPKLAKGQIRPMLEKFLSVKMESGERFRGQQKYSQDFKSMYGVGSVGLVNKVLAQDESLQAWATDKSVSAKSYAEVSAATAPAEYLDEQELKKSFLERVEMQHVPDDQKAEALELFLAMEPRLQKEMLDTLDS